MNGELIVNVYNDSVANPVIGAEVEILDEKIFLFTDQSGKTEKVTLTAPNIEYSLTNQSEVQPFSTYDIRVSKEGLIPTIIYDVQIFAGEVSLQSVYLKTLNTKNDQTEQIQIQAPTLWNPEAPKVVSDEQDDNKAKVLKEVIIPEYIIVHDGIPNDTKAVEYTVSFVDYVKNVACSEIYSSWPIECIKANVLAIISFTLNRIYTEWYRSKGYNFTITSTTTYDQKYTPDRTIFESISKIVDEIFYLYIRKSDRPEPYLSHYWDGSGDNRPGWMSQWGSKDLADRGYSFQEILNYYYGSAVVIDETKVVSENPTSFPGYVLSKGMCAEPIQKLQNELNVISSSYPKIPKIFQPDGKFLDTTENSVKIFQEVFDLPVTGIVDYSTWYAIGYIYVAVTKMIITV